MRKGSLKHVAVLVVIFVAATVAAGPAAAYLGPGAGLGMIGSLIAVIGVVLVALFGIVFYPMRRLLKRRRKNMAVAGSDHGGSPSGPSSGF